MGWWITLGILFLLAILPLGVRVCYDEDGVRVHVLLGKLAITVFPVPRWLQKKEKAEKKEEPAKEEAAAAPPAETGGEAKQEPPAAEPEKKGGKLKDFLPFVRLGLNFLGDFRRKLRVNYCKLRLVLAGDDPCDLALNYGRTWAALGNLQPQLERFFVVKKRDLQVACDFTATETLVNARLDITITLGRLLALAAVYGVRAVKLFFQMKKTKKAVQNNESETSQHA